MTGEEIRAERTRLDNLARNAGAKAAGFRQFVENNFKEAFDKITCGKIAAQFVMEEARSLATLYKDRADAADRALKAIGDIENVVASLKAQLSNVIVTTAEASGAQTIADDARRRVKW